MTVLSDNTFCSIIDQLIHDYISNTNEKNIPRNLDELILNVFRTVDLLKPTGNLEQAWSKYISNQTRIVQTDMILKDAGEQNKSNNATEASIPSFGKKHKN